MRNSNTHYTNINEEENGKRENTPWYWRLIALAASWMILGGYLILPGLYAKDPQLKFSQAVLTVFVVAFLTAGYSFTALLCFACRNELFQAEGVFIPALTSSALGLLSIAYNFLSSHAYTWSTSAITGIVVSTTATLIYTALLLWTHRRIIKLKEKAGPRQLWSNESYYSNFISNMYPTVGRSPSRPDPVLTEDDRVSQQMAMLLTKRHTHSRSSPDANSSTFRIDLPEDTEQREREAYSQELVGTPATPADWNRPRADSRPDSLSENSAWGHRGRAPNRPPSGDQRSTHSRGLSREERRREIELGLA